MYIENSTKVYLISPPEEPAIDYPVLVPFKLLTGGSIPSPWQAHHWIAGGDTPSSEPGNKTAKTFLVKNTVLFVTSPMLYLRYGDRVSPVIEFLL